MTSDRPPFRRLTAPRLAAALPNVLLLVALAAHLPACSDRPAAPTTPAATATTSQLEPPQVRAGRVQLDPQAVDPELRERTDRDLRRRPAFQALPVETDHMVIELVGAARDGRALLLVTSNLPVSQARARYRAWLRAHGDSGRAYRPIFQRRPRRAPPAAAATAQPQTRP